MSAFHRITVNFFHACFSYHSLLQFYLQASTIKPNVTKETTLILKQHMPSDHWKPGKRHLKSNSGITPFVKKHI